MVRQLADLTTPSTPATSARRSHRARWIALGVAVPVALLIAVLAVSPPSGTRAADSPLLGKPAPAFDAPALDGQPVQLSSFRGRWVVVNFFATWCAPCRDEHPDLVRFANQHRQLGDASVVGVIYDDNIGAVRSFRDREGGDWPMLIDDGGRIALDFGVSGIPESFLISPAGVVAAKVVGGIRAAALDQLLTQLKARPSAPE